MGFFRGKLYKLRISLGVDVVIQFPPWFKFSFLLFLGKVMMIMSLKQKKLKFKPWIKLNHNIDIHPRHFPK